MISRQQHNEALRKTRRERAQMIRDKYLECNKCGHMVYNQPHKPLGEEERIAIRQDAKNELRKLRRRSIFIFLLILIPLGYICFWLLDRFW